MADCALDQRLDLVVARDVAGDDMGVAAGLPDTVCNSLAGVNLATGNHYLGAELCQQFRRGTADAAAGAGDDRDFSGEIERGSLHCTLPHYFVRLWYLSVMPGLVPGIHALLCSLKTWMAGSSPAMTTIVELGTPAMTGLNQPAAGGDAAQMKVGVAKGVLDHGQPLEVVADLGFLRHADAAMELDRLLADVFRGLADLHFRRRHRGGALLGVVEVGRHGGEHRHAAGLLPR